MARALALLWTLAIAVALGVPGSSLPEGPILAFDKVVHVGLFAVLGVLWLRAYPRAVRAVLLAGLGFALLTEVYQHLLPISRTFSLYDVLADALGLALALGAWWWLRRRAETPA